MTRICAFLLLLVLPVRAEEMVVVWGSRRIAEPVARLAFPAVAGPSRFSLQAGKFTLGAAGLPELKDCIGHTYPAEGQWQGRPWKGTLRVQSVENNVTLASIQSPNASGWFRARVEVLHFP